MMILRVVTAVIGALAGGMLCSFYWGGDDAGSWTPWWEVVLWLILTALGILAGVVSRFPLSMLFSFSVPMLGMIPVAIAVHFLKRKHPDE